MTKMAASRGLTCSCMLRKSGSASRRAIAAANASTCPQQQQRSCLHTTSSALAESSTASSSTSQGPASTAASFSPSGPSHSQQQQSQQKISASLLLSRPPFLTRTPSNFEAAVFAYNNKLSRSLSQPFSKDFYFKKGSAAELKFEQLEAQRRKGGFNVPESQAGAGKGKGKKGGKSSPAQESGEESSPVAAAEDPEQELYAVLPRRTAADEAKDVKSLERQGERTLYLLVKDKKTGLWRFPSEPIDRRAPSSSGSAAPAGQKETEPAEGEAGKGPKDTLHSAAPRAVRKLLGDNMDIWLVTHMPVGVLSDEASKEKTYFIPAHILSGNADKSSLQESGVDFAWLSQEEIGERLSKGTPKDQEYWKMVEKLLSE